MDRKRGAHQRSGFFISCAVYLLVVQGLRAGDPQTALSEVASIPFGSSREHTVETLNKRFGMAMPPSIQKPSELYFSGGEFAGVSVGGWWFRFAANQLYEVSLTFETTAPLRTLDKVAALLAQKYGAPSETERSYSFPYNVPFRSLDDVKIKQAFKDGKADFHSLWRLTNGSIVAFCQLPKSDEGEIRLYLTYTQSEFAKKRSDEASSDL